MSDQVHDNLELLLIRMVGTGGAERTGIMTEMYTASIQGFNTLGMKDTCRKP